MARPTKGTLQTRYLKYRPAPAPKPKVSPRPPAPKPSPVPTPAVSPRGPAPTPSLVPTFTPPVPTIAPPAPFYAKGGMPTITPAPTIGQRVSDFILRGIPGALGTAGGRLGAFPGIQNAPLDMGGFFRAGMEGRAPGGAVPSGVGPSAEDLRMRGRGAGRNATYRANLASSARLTGLALFGPGYNPASALPPTGVGAQYYGGGGIRPNIMSIDVANELPWKTYGFKSAEEFLKYYEYEQVDDRWWQLKEVPDEVPPVYDWGDGGGGGGYGGGGYYGGYEPGPSSYRGASASSLGLINWRIGL